MITRTEAAGSRLFVVLACMALAACGGGGGSGASPGGGNGGTGGTGNDNTDPTADAGEPITVDAGLTVTLEGSGEDSDGEISKITWSQASGDSVSLTSNDDGTATFVAPSVQAATDLIFTLTVEDDDGATASDDVKVTVAPVIGMSGRIYDGPIANANVTVTVGDRTYTAVADADGNYVVNVGSVDPDAFITISATGPEGQEHVELVSIAASFGSLQAAAGDDGVVDDSDAGSVDVTNLSTAKAVLMIESNGGEPITSDEAAAEAERNVNGDELLELATVIKLVVDGGFELPEGVDSTLDLIDDTETAGAFVDSVNAEDPTALDTMKDEMLSDPELVDTFDASDVPGEYNLILVNTLKSTGTIEYQMGNRVQKYAFKADGTGTVITNFASYSGSFTWEVVDGQVEIAFDTPMLSGGSCWIDGYELQVSCDVTTERATLRLLVDGAAGDQVQLREYHSITYPLNPELEQPVTSESVLNWLALADDMLIPINAEDVPGVWGSAVASRDESGLAVDSLDPGLLSFAADGTGFRVANPAASALDFTWQVNDAGVLEIAFVDGSDMTIRLLREEGIAYDAQMEFTSAEGEVLVDAGLVVRQDAEFVQAVDAQTAKGFYTLYGQHPDFAVVLQDGGIGLQRTYFDDGTLSDFPLGWTVNGSGQVVMNYRWDDLRGENVTSCLDPEACHNWRERLWIPVAYDEEHDRVFTYELQRWFAYDDTQPEARGAVQGTSATLRFWGYSDTSLADDLVIGKPAFTEDKRRTPWVRLDPRVRVFDE